MTDQVNAELANSITHGLGVLFGIIAIPLLIAIAVQGGDSAGITGVCIYGFSFLMVFTASTLYHMSSHPTIKKVMKIIDHISIYFMIAGTYTPFILYNIFDARGITMISILWGVAFLGIFYKIFFIGKSKLFSLIIYLSMGWAVAFAPSDFYSSLSTASIALIIIGGALYSIGVIFYLMKKYKYSHAIWHLFVLAASICHYIAILLAIN